MQEYTAYYLLNGFININYGGIAYESKERLQSKEAHIKNLNINKLLKSEPSEYE